jgi:hypothetical protein
LNLIESALQNLRKVLDLAIAQKVLEAHAEKDTVHALLCILNI